MKNPLISVVMPAYNSAKYIREAIESVLNQSFEDWELIIVDDASTDNTYFLALEYAEKDGRIKVFSSQYNSGTVQVPRQKAISIAAGEWILGVDSDDFIEKDDILKLYNRAIVTQADIVLHRLVAVSEKGRILGDTIPSMDFNINTVFTGREACMKTIGQWVINGNGIFKSELYNKLLCNRHVTNVNSDEYDTRFLLLNASKVAFCDAQYYYRQNFSSITKKISLKRFDVLDVDKDLDILIEKEYGVNSVEYSQMVNQRINNLIALTGLLIQNKHLLNQEEKMNALSRLQISYSEVDKKRYLPTSLFKKQVLTNGWPLFYLTVILYFRLKK